MKTITLALTGASGMPYTFRLLECLLQADCTVNIIQSPAAKMVIQYETDLNLPSQPKALKAHLVDKYNANPDKLHVYSYQDWMAPIASGSNISDAMVVCPCTSGALAAIALGASDNLLERAADVTIKEQKKLVLVIRETPFSAIHLENMLKLAKLGCCILPANPGFYNKPKSIDDLVDFIVARVLDQIEVKHDIQKRWGT